jgi:hypothetical protein
MMMILIAFARAYAGACAGHRIVADLSGDKMQ